MNYLGVFAGVVGSFLFFLAPHVDLPYFAVLIKRLCEGYALGCLLADSLLNKD